MGLAGLVVAGVGAGSVVLVQPLVYYAAAAARCPFAEVREPLSPPRSVLSWQGSEGVPAFYGKAVRGF